jgi:two-component system LytT family response regulator
MVRCIIADDELPARRILETYVDHNPQLVLAGVCTSALEVFALISREPVDLLFLDIRMPGLSGIELMKNLKEPPAVIFTTAYPNYAVESYELGAVDYLMKPITNERFAKAVSRFLNGLTPESAVDFLYIKDNGRLVRIAHVDLLYAQSVKDYLVIRTVEETFVTHMTMKYLEELLPAPTFERVHRSYLVNRKHVRVIRPRELDVAGFIVPLGKTYRNLY